MSIVQQKSNYTNKNILYLKNVSITEYDLKSGGFNVIREFKLLPEDKIKLLETYEKDKRNIVIGKIQAKSSKLSKEMVEGFGKARTKFVELNRIPDENILSIKKDALFLINCNNIQGKVGEYLEFRMKNKYSSYMRLNNKEFYFSPFEDLEVKGLSDECKEKQKDYLLKDINMFLNQNEKIPPEMLFNNLKKYRSNYLERKLPIETYRNLDTGVFNFGNFDLDDIDESFLTDLDISYNYINYVLPMIQNFMKDIIR